MAVLHSSGMKRQKWSYWDLWHATPVMTTNKRLHRPRTTDCRHTIQDRWIQTELASTLAKNATKPNPFDIIPLQTTRKENNWKTEEALARAAVTLETERIKGSNPWCLWWWWWWRYWRWRRRRRRSCGLFCFIIVVPPSDADCSGWRRMFYCAVPAGRPLATSYDLMSS